MFIIKCVTYFCGASPPLALLTRAAVTTDRCQNQRQREPPSLFPIDVRAITDLHPRQSSSLLSSLGHRRLPPDLQPQVSPPPFVVFSIHVFSGLLLKHVLPLRCSKPVSGYSLSLETKEILHRVSGKVCRDRAPGTSGITSLC